MYLDNRTLSLQAAGLSKSEWLVYETYTLWIEFQP